MIDGPFAETKEQLLGFYVVDCATLEEAIEIARELSAGQSRRRLRDPAGGAVPAGVAASTDDRRRPGSISRCGRRGPRAVGALLRYFRDLDAAEEAFQDACLAALKNWPKNGPPRDPAAWLIFVGRNAALDDARRRRKQRAAARRRRAGESPTPTTPRPTLAERLDDAHYRDDILRLLFVCCHPELPATQQIALALRIVCGLSVKEIARAFLVGESAMEQRITRAKSRVAAADVPFETPGAPERGRAPGGGRRGDLPDVQRGLLGDRRRGAASARRCARRRSGSRACCCGSSPTSPRSWACWR